MIAKILSMLKLILDIGLICLDIFTEAMDIYRKCKNEFMEKYAAQVEATTSAA